MSAAWFVWTESDSADEEADLITSDFVEALAAFMDACMNRESATLKWSS